jgi:hypothetical protein
MWKKILLGFVGLIVFVIAITLYLTSGMTDTAEAFFRNISEKQYTKAYSYLSEDFKQAVSKDKMIAFMQQTGLEKYKNANWGNRSFEGNRGEIEGTIETTTGSAIPITIHFVKLDDGSWRIYAIDKPASGVKIENKPVNTDMPAVPDANESIVLVKDTIRHFARAVNNKDMGKFHTFASQAFQKEVSVAKLNRAFKSFMDMNIDFMVLDSMKPVLDPKPVLNNGILVIRGYYETSPKKLYYDLSYIRENKQWKLLNMNIEIK